MSTGILSKAISNLVEEAFEKKADDFTMVNVRPGEKVSAMLDVIAHLHQKTPSMLIADALSRKLAAHAGSSRAHADAILDAAGQVVSRRGGLSANTALGMLEAQGLVEVRNPFMKRVDL